MGPPETRYRALFEANPAPLWVIDAETLSFLTVNEAAVRHYGYSREEFLGMTLKDILPPEDVSRLLEYVFKVSDVPNLAGTWRHRRKDGSTMNVELMAHAIRVGDRRAVLAISDEVAELKRPGPLLQEGEVRLRSLLDQVPAVVWSTDKELCFTVTLGAGLKALNVQPNQVVGKALSDYVETLDSGPAAIAVHRRALEGESLSHEQEWKGRIFEWRVEPLRNDEGRIAGTIGVAVDVTERKQAELAHKHAHLLLEAVMECATSAIAALDLEGKFTLVNRRAADLTGYAAEEFIGRSLAFLLPPENVDRIWGPLQRTLREGVVISGDETELVRKDRSRRIISFSLAPILQGGKISGVVVTAEDITGRERAERHAIEMEEKYRSIFERAVKGISQTTEDGKFLAANPACARMLGYDSPEDLMRSVTDIENQLYADPADWREFLRLVNERGEVSAFETRYRRKDGSIIWVSANSRAVRDNTGRLLHYEGAFYDITEPHRADQELRDLSGRLLKLRDEERRRFARELHDSTGQILTGLTINLNLISTSVAGLDPRARQILSDSISLAEQCTREIRSLAYVLHPPLLDEAGLFSALRWYTEGFAKRSNIRVELDVAPELGRLPAEIETALFRVVQECLSNILRHSGSPTARIRIRRDDNEVRLEVGDEGKGINSRALERNSNGGFPVLGVGIAGMRERLRLLGGRLEIQTHAGGTTVRAILPIE